MIPNILNGQRKESTGEKFCERLMALCSRLVGTKPVALAEVETADSLLFTPKIYLFIFFLQH